MPTAQTYIKALSLKTSRCEMGQKRIKYSYQSQLQKDYNLEHMWAQLCKIDFPNNFLTVWGSSVFFRMLWNLMNRQNREKIFQ